MQDLLQNKVDIKLNSMANDKETFLQFIRNSETEHGIVHQDLNGCSMKQLDHYIEFLDDLWNK